MGRQFRAILARVLAPLVASMALAVVIPGHAALAESNGAALKPQLGWSTWSFIRHNPTEANVEAQAQAMHSSGLQAHGYQYVNVDDFWYKCANTVDSFGRWAVDTSKFPNGIDAVAAYVHGLGLKFGIYVTPGIPFEAVTLNTPIQGTPYHAQDIANTSVIEKNYNCHQMYGIDYSKPGSQEFINSWANEFAAWGVDYLKLDGVGTWDIPDLQAWSKALVSSGRLIHLELSNNLAVTSATTWQQYSNGWRIDGDIECYCNSSGGSYPLTSWSKVARRFSDDPKWAQFGGPGGWNDLDSLELGNGSNDGLTTDQRQTHMTLWAMAAAPLILGSDLTNLDPFDLSLMTNDEVLAVDQAGIPGSPLVAGATQQVWRARQPDGSYYVALFNLDTVNSASVSVTWSQLGFSGPATVRDLWSHTDLGAFASGFGATLSPTASRLVKVVPSSTGFSLSASPASQSVNQGGSTTYSVSVGAINGFTGSVSLSVAGLPSGATASFNPASVTGSGTSTLTVATTSGTPTGSSTLTVSGTSGPTTHAANAVTLVVKSPTVPDFSLSATPASESVAAGGTATYTVTVTPSNGYGGTVALSIGGLPSGATASFNPASIGGSGSSTLTVATGSGTPAGTSALTISGADSMASLSHTAGVSLTVEPPGCVQTTQGGPWQNSAFANQTGTFTVQFDATPSMADMNGVIGLSNGAQTAYTGFAAIARFNPTGDIDARNGGGYAAASTIPYQAGASYHFRMAVDITTRTYSIYVTAPGGTEQTVGSGFAFRTEQSGVTQLNWWGAFSEVGSEKVCGFALT